jgi:hypothetical protein
MISMASVLLRYVFRAANCSTIVCAVSWEIGRGEIPEPLSRPYISRGVRPTEVLPLQFAPVGLQEVLAVRSRDAQVDASLPSPSSLIFIFGDLLPGPTGRRALSPKQWP